MILKLLKRMVAATVIIFAVQGCAIFVSDRDDFHGHREHWRHEHSSLQTVKSAKRVEGKEMNASQSGVDS